LVVIATLQTLQDRPCTWGNRTNSRAKLLSVAELDKKVGTLHIYYTLASCVSKGSILESDNMLASTTYFKQRRAATFPESE
ncbi:MAG: hypothetical protein ACK56I_00805, partial [bacterium]